MDNSTDDSISSEVQQSHEFDSTLNIELSNDNDDQLPQDNLNNDHNDVDDNNND